MIAPPSTWRHRLLWMAVTPGAQRWAISRLLELRPRDEGRWDLVALGEVMLRLDPGDERISTARTFRAWEGGGEYNVARALRKCFGLRTAVVTALADNPVGRLIEDLILQGGVDTSLIRWVPYDGIGRSVRNGLNFTERGFGVRNPIGCSDRGHTAASQLEPGDVDWSSIFEEEGACWFHCGGIFAGLSATTADAAEEAMAAARSAGVMVSYDLNFRPSIWEGSGGTDRAVEVNRHLARLVDVMLGNEEQFRVALGYEIEVDARFDEARRAGAESGLDTANCSSMLAEVAADFPNLKLIAASLRAPKSATVNDWGGICLAEGRVVKTELWRDLEILDRVGGGDSFASGLVYGLLTGAEIKEALEYAVAHGALTMTTPGDTSMATLEEVRRLAARGSVRVQR